MNRKSTLILIFGFLFSQWLYGSAPTLTIGQQIDTIVANNMQQHGIPGLAIAVLKDGKPLLMKGYGYADVQQKQLVTLKTLFAIGSISKVLTAFALMSLVQEGKINLDDSVLKYIPKAPPQWQAVTIRQLLSHTSGIPQHQGPHLPWGQIWTMMANKPMEFTPGTAVKYNNFGYIVLGRVIENVSQQSLDIYLNQTIFTPLIMRNTGFPANLFPPGLATGYRVNAGEVPMPNPNKKPWLQMWSSGGIVSTISDMAKWDRAMSAGKILSVSSYRQMWSPVFLKNGQPAGHKNWAWSLGWQVSYTSDELVAAKNGAIRGYSSWIVRHIDNHLSIIILTNTNKVPLKRIARQIFKQIKLTKNSVK
ncbi:serine hydrolase domain-containing protein [Legionella hackeliae]|uniref:Putative beta-lactamase n=1 Tax=Legionella hackeliae TaxID=449 RepID=A0A0A8USA9_LEGHA|nr:serine hydrolase domain-containing protein [Legionella hackeliae]KTD09944.1 beta-lactamase [Legionella hackeliae]CEK11755.1 putative beta-lactamase [Legionella hackeliae]STX48526.1 beta-lactamase [Legionella hackeliae]